MHVCACTNTNTKTTWIDSKGQGKFIFLPIFSNLLFHQVTGTKYMYKFMVYIVENYARPEHWDQNYYEIPLWDLHSLKLIIFTYRYTLTLLSCYDRIVAL